MAHVDTPQLKADLRKQYSSIRGGIAQALREAHGKAAQEALLQDPVWQSARQVALYMPIRAEMDTALLLADAWARKIEVLLPRCVTGEMGRMDFVPCTGPEHVTTGLWGILEPQAHCMPLPWDSQYLAPQVALVPALAYDLRGYRLGYGGGYYDRALRHACFAATRTVGMCYKAQCTEQLPVQPWDFPVNALCTEEGLQWL